MRCAYDHDIARNHGCSMQADFALLQINFLIVIEFQIDDAAAAKSRDRIARLGVQCDQPIAGRDIDDSFVPTIGPVGQPASGQLPRSVGAAHAFVFTVTP